MWRYRLRVAGMSAIAALVAVSCSADIVVPPVEDSAPAVIAPTPTAVIAQPSTPPARPERRPGDGVTVVAGRANWAPGFFHAALSAALLEELGYDVTEPADNELPPSAGYVALAEGRLDYWPNGSYPEHLQHHLALLDDGSTVGDNVSVVGRQTVAGGTAGLLVTRTWADESGIETLRQINDDPALYQALDSDGNGRGEISGCPADWTCGQIIDALLLQNKLTNLEQRQGGYLGLVVAAGDRVEQGLPTLQYTWSPSVHLLRLTPGKNVLWLSVGEDGVLDGSLEVEWDFRGPASDLGDTCTAVDCFTGWPRSDMLITANNEFLAANPAAAELFRQIEVDVLDVARYLEAYNQADGIEAVVAEQVSDWVSRNSEVVDTWLDAARSAT